MVERERERKRERERDGESARDRARGKDEGGKESIKSTLRDPLTISCTSNVSLLLRECVKPHAACIKIDMSTKSSMLWSQMEPGQCKRSRQKHEIV